MEDRRQDREGAKTLARGWDGVRLWTRVRGKRRGQQGTKEQGRVSIEW